MKRPINILNRLTALMALIAFIPLGANAVGDFLSDADELNIFGTDPNLFDTDYDGISDIEFIFGLNPLDPADAVGDLDIDGFTNLEEVLLLSWPGDSNSTPAIESNFNVSFEGP